MREATKVAGESKRQRADFIPEAYRGQPDAAGEADDWVNADEWKGREPGSRAACCVRHGRGGARNPGTFNLTGEAHAGQLPEVVLFD